MSMKTKDRCGKHPNEAGMLLKKNEIDVEGGNVVEKTMGYVQG
jgi:hypothetical protein